MVDAGRTKEVFGGDLRDVSLSSLLQLTQAESFSGWIRIELRGEIALDQGMVVGARCGPLTGVEALRELLFREGGRFVMIRGLATGAPPLDDDVTRVVMDAYRLRDEWGRISSAVLRRAQDRSWLPTGAPIDELMVALDGRHSIGALMARGNGVITPIVDALLAALGDGVVERVRPGRDPPPSLPPLPTPPSPPHVSILPPPIQTPIPSTDFFELVDRARTLMRANDLEAAEAALKRALELRPGDRVALQNLRALAQRRGPRTSER